MLENSKHRKRRLYEEGKWCETEQMTREWIDHLPPSSPESLLEDEPEDALLSERT